MGLPIIQKGFRVLDFDIESRPLSYWGDRPTAEMTAIAWAWADDPKTLTVMLLGPDSKAEMLRRFREVYDAADMVTGHNIRRFDLRFLNGEYWEHGFPILGPKMTEDTYGDLTKKLDLPATQEYLCELLNVGHQKKHMTQFKWREANRLSTRGMAETSERVGEDVLGHMELRRAMRIRGMLGAPKVWRP